MPESAGLGPARSSRCPGWAGLGSRAWGAGPRPASARFVPTEVTLPCAMLAVPAPHLFPQAACSVTLCTFTDVLSFGVYFFPIRT